MCDIFLGKFLKQTSCLSTHHLRDRFFSVLFQTGFLCKLALPNHVSPCVRHNCTKIGQLIVVAQKVHQLPMTQHLKISKVALATYWVELPNVAVAHGLVLAHPQKGSQKLCAQVQLVYFGNFSYFLYQLIKIYVLEAYGEKNCQDPICSIKSHNYNLMTYLIW